MSITENKVMVIKKKPLHAPDFPETRGAVRWRGASPSAGSPAPSRGAHLSLSTSSNSWRKLKAYSTSVADNNFICPYSGLLPTPRRCSPGGRQSLTSFLRFV